MRILLLNNNPVVSRLVAIAAQNSGFQLEEVAHLSRVSRFDYDAILIDDMSFNDDEAALLEAFRARKRLFFSSKTSGNEIGERFDAVLKKPFLPSQVEKVLDEIAQEDAMILPEDQGDYFFVLDEATPEETDTQVLDEAEVERIKALLDENEEIKDDDAPIEGDDTALEERKVQAITENLQKEGLEIVDEATMIESLTETEAKTPALTMDGDTFLEMLATMKTKKLKKLLKGAKVTLTVEFGED